MKTTIDTNKNEGKATQQIYLKDEMGRSNVF